MRQLSEENREFLYQTFEVLHQCPEAGFCEVQTSTYIAEALKQMGYEVKEHIGKTGIVAVLDSHNPGLNFALRADMDALQYTIDGKQVCYHGCGHDGRRTDRSII